MSLSFTEQRLALSFTAWFRIPAHMQQREMLSRASAFVVTAKEKRAKSLHIVTALHVPCPFHFPKYYPRAQYPWLGAVKPEHVSCTVELRKPSTGKIIQQFDLDSRIFASEDRDLCVMHLRDEGAFADFAESNWVTPVDLRGEHDFEKDRELEFLGHEVPDQIPSNLDEAFQYPHVEPGRFNVKTASQYFAITKKQLSMGMCGGPVMHRGQCVGLLEGIVPKHPDPESLPELHRRVLGNACFIPASDVISLLSAVEADSPAPQDAL